MITMPFRVLRIGKVTSIGTLRRDSCLYEWFNNRRPEGIVSFVDAKFARFGYAQS